MKFVLASQNKGKIKEIKRIMDRLGLELCSESDLNLNIDVEETGSTFEENSLLKATAIMKATGLPTIADDSGLCVDALNGAPGVYSARYGGKDIDNIAKCNLLLSNMPKDKPRTAKFVCVITCCFPSGDIIQAKGECAGEIAHQPQGDSGFAYDYIFLPNGIGKTFAEITIDEKNQISHRGKALVTFQNKLKEYLDNL